MDYTVASSSTEEGEITEKSFPYYKSYIQYYYYPTSTRLIGKNTLPRFADYKGDSYCSRMKKELKHDYPYISLGLLEENRGFFDNRFTHCGPLQPVEAEEEETLPLLGTATRTGHEYVLKTTKENYKEVSNLSQKSVCEFKYDKLCQQLFFTKESGLPIVQEILEYKAKRIILIEDRMLEAIDNKNAYMFFRVASKESEGADGKQLIKLVIFEDIFYSGIPFYDYLGLCAERLIKTFNSEEIRIYQNDSSLLVVYSSTAFKSGSLIQRLYSTPDLERNTMVLFNREGPKLESAWGAASKNGRYFAALDLDEGDYMINNKIIYKVSSQGEQVEFCDIDFSDFTKNRWET